MLSPIIFTTTSILPLSSLSPLASIPKVPPSTLLLSHHHLFLASLSVPISLNRWLPHLFPPSSNSPTIQSLPTSQNWQSSNPSLFEPNSTHAHSNQDTWPLGFNDEEEAQPSFRFDPSSSLSLSVPFSSLKELVEALEKLRMDVVEALSHAVGFDSPMHENGRGCLMMWVSLSSSLRNDKVEYEDGDGEAGLDPGEVYPYVVGLEYQIKRKYSLIADSGWVFAETGCRFHPRQCWRHCSDLLRQLE